VSLLTGGETARLLEDLADLWRRATAEQRAELAQTLFAEVRVRDKAIVGATLAQPEMLPLVASATWRNAAGGAPPDGSRPPTHGDGRSPLCATVTPKSCVSAYPPSGDSRHG